jgi:hypothetical protein
MPVSHYFWDFWLTPIENTRLSLPRTLEMGEKKSRSVEVGLVWHF